MVFKILIQSSIVKKERIWCLSMISIIIPSYNRADTILKSVQSVLNQTYNNIEVIVVDDGSTDNTRAILQQIQDPRLKYVYQENAGACVARNNGIDHARGDYIAFHDSDDTFRPTKLEDQLHALREKGADVVFCAMERHNYYSETIFPQIEEGFKSQHEILIGQYISTQTILGKKEVFLNNRFDPKVKRMQDYDLMIRVSSQYKVFFLKKVLVDVVVQNDSITKLATNEKTEKNLEYLLSKYSKLGDKYPDWKSVVLEYLAYFRLLQNKKYKGIYREAFSLDKSPKKFLKMLLAYSGILKIIYKNRHK